MNATTTIPTNHAGAPDCYRCVHRCQLTFSAHSSCHNIVADVKGDPHGDRKGWFLWPLNFDPVWLLACSGFSDNPADKLPPAGDKTDLAGLLALLARAASPG